jgi:hypothetical protein
MSLPVQLAADLLLNVQGVNKAQKDIEKAVGGAATRGLSSAIKSTQKLVKSEYSKAYEDALRIGHKEQAAQLKEQYKASRSAILADGKAIKKLNQQIAKEKDKDAKKRLKAERKGLESNIKLEQKAMRNMITERASAQEEQLKLLDEGMERAARSFGDKAEDSADSFVSIVNNGLTLDNLNPEDLFKGMGDSLKKNKGSLSLGGKNLSALGGKMGGMKGGAMKLMGGMMGKMAALAVPLAAAASAIGAIVGVMAAAYGKVKDWNKAILESVSYYDMMESSSGALEPRLANMRTAMSRVSRTWNISAEAAMGYVSALNEAGITVRELKGWTRATKSVTAYSRAMNFGIKYTKALGISASDLGTLQQQMLEGFGMRMRSLDESMSSFGASAQEAGMSSRSFVAAIMEGTANMALYNFRLADTEKLLVGLAGILGEDLATSMLGMEGTFKNMGTQDRYKASMTGGGTMEGVLKAGAKRQIEGRAVDISMDSDLRRAFRDSGLMDMANEFDIDKLASLKGVELGKVQNSIAKAVEKSTGSKAAGQGAVRSLEDLTMQARLLSGGATTSEKADAMAAMDRPTELAAKVAQGLDMTGASDFGDITGTTRMLFEDLTGIMGEEFETTKEIFNRAQATLSVQEGRDVSLSETLKKLSEDPDSLLSDEDSAALAAAAEAADPALDIAKQTLMATQTVGDVISGKISGLLGGIGGGITNLANFWSDEYNLFKGDDEDARKAIAQADEVMAKSRDEMAEIQAEMRKVGTSDMSEKDKKLADKELEAKYKKAERKVDAAETMKSDIQSGILNADDAQAQYLDEAYGNANVLSATRSAIRSGRGDEVDGALSYSYRHGQRNTQGNQVFHGQAIDLGRINRETLLYDKKKDMTDADGNLMNIADNLIQNEGAIRDSAAMIEFMESEEATQEKAAEEAEKAAVQAAKDAKAQEDVEKKTEEGVRAIVKELRKQSLDTIAADVEAAIIASGGEVGKFGEKIKAGKEGSGLAGLRAQLEKGGVSKTEMALMRRLGISTEGLKVDPAAKDFVYQGNSMGGVITPIDDQDSFFGAKPGGALSKMGGRSIVISNLTINESGDPQKTLRMVKQALRAADRA